MTPNKPIPGSVKLPEWIKQYVPEELAQSSLFRFDTLLQVEETGPDGKQRKKRITVDLLPDLDLDYEILETQLQNLPAQYAFFAAVYSEVRMNSELVERALKAKKGNIVKMMVSEAGREKIRFTADQIKIVLESDEGLMRLDEQYQKLQMQAGKLYHMLEALKMKSELARSLAGFKRKEYGAE